MRQKRVVFILALLFFIVPYTQAQSESKSKSIGGMEISYGAKVGLVSSDFASDFQKLESTESRTSFSGGLFGSIKITDLIGVTLEALYVQEGTMRLNSDYIYYRTSIPGSGVTLNRVNSNIVMHNIEVPLMVDLYLGKSEYNPRVYLGGSFDYILSVTAKNLWAYYGGNDQRVVSKRKPDNVSSSFKQYNVGAIIGAGISYDMFNFDIRYKFGTMPVNNLATYNFRNTYKENFSTNVLMITVGVNINKLF